MSERAWVPFTPTAQSVRIIAAGNVQQGRRRLVVMRDQHRHANHPNGRAWWGWVEKQAADDALAPAVVGELYPVQTFSRIPISKTKTEDCEGWSAPWFPPPAYINRAIDLAEGNHFAIDYNGMAVEWESAHKRYYARAVTDAIANKLTPIPKFGEPVDFAIQAITGIPPMSPRIPRAAMTGHEWLLGFSNERDEVLAGLLNVELHLEQIAEAAEKLAQRNANLTPGGDAMIGLLTTQLEQARREREDLIRRMDQMQATFAEAVANKEEILTPTPEKPRKRNLGKPKTQRGQAAQTDDAPETTVNAA